MSEPDESESPKRRAILTSASELFVARGYGAISMDAIARAADVSKATLYAHFESKDRLFATIVQDACRETIMPEDGLPGCDTEIAAALHAIGGRILRFFLRPRTLAIHRLVLAESVRFPELGLAFYDNGPAAARAMLAAWMARHPALRLPDPDLAAEQFLGLLRTGLHTRASLGLEREAPEPEIETVVEAAVRTFTAAYRA